VEIAIRDVETLAWLRDYFQLEVDLEKLYKEWALKDPVFAKFRDRFQGIRMLRQDPWENLVSYVLSYTCAFISSSRTLVSSALQTTTSPG
jgi:N-glycosylase/DNA lyase